MSSYSTMSESALLEHLRVFQATPAQRAEADRIAGQRMAGIRGAEQEWEAPGLYLLLEALEEVVLRDDPTADVPWQCSSCGAVWHTYRAADSFGCQSPNCSH